MADRSIASPTRFQAGGSITSADHPETFKKGQLKRLVKRGLSAVGHILDASAETKEVAKQAHKKWPALGE